MMYATGSLVVDGIGDGVNLVVYHSSASARIMANICDVSTMYMCIVMIIEHF